MLIPSGERCVGIVTLLALAAVPQARADEPRPPETRTAHASPLEEKQFQLRGLQDTIDASGAHRQALVGEIAALKTDHARFAADLIETTRKIGEQEAKIADGQQRLDVLAGQESGIKRSLEGRRAVVAEVLAALQRMGRKPPPALLVDPEDVLKAIRSSMMLSAVLPGMRAEMEALVADLIKLAQIRAAMEAERQQLDKGLAASRAERQRLAVLIDARQSALGKAEADVDAEREKAKQLAEQAGSLKELIERMERESAAASNSAQAARESTEKLAAMMPNGIAKPNTAPFKDTSRLSPAVAFNKTKGLLPLPVTGKLLRRFGDDDGLGSTEKGMLLETRASSVVASPADGWIAYAGPYRSFGQLLILNAGGGYYIVLAGMDRVNVSLGQFVLAGEPIAVMGDGSAKTAAAIALGAVQPVLYVEFRKDGATIDPGPWWAKPELQRVRG